MGLRRRPQRHVCEAIGDVASTAAIKTPKVKDNLHNVMLIKGEVASADTLLKWKKFIQETSPNIEVFNSQ